jgi:hypothetical protein
MYNNSMKILHTCSSVLVRPNGIMRYINSVMTLQQAGHEVAFACDSDPTAFVDHNSTWDTENPASEYQPNWRDGHVWLQVDQDLIAKLKRVLVPLVSDADVVVAHDLHSYLAASQLTPHGVFVQHESDVLNRDGRYSFLSDEYLNQQIAVVESPDTEWYMGMTASITDISAPRAVFTPVPFEFTPLPEPVQRQGLLYVGDATERKGAREFMALARKLGVVPTVISWEQDHEVFAGATVHRFELDQHQAMLELINQHAVAYIPSRNEAMSLAVFECLQYIPVVLDSQYSWTRTPGVVGAILYTGDAIEQAARERLTFTTHDTSRLAMWCEHAQYIWTQGFKNWPVTSRR